MHGLVARNSGVLGATAAAVLLAMQLAVDGLADYTSSDVMTILLIAVPVVARTVRPRSARHRDAPPAPRPDGAPTAAPAHGPPDDAADEEAAPRTVERLLARWIALGIVGAAWLTCAVLVLLQAWAAVASALIVMALAAAAIPAEPDGTPVASSRGPGR